MEGQSQEVGPDLPEICGAVGVVTSVVEEPDLAAVGDGVVRGHQHAVPERGALVAGGGAHQPHPGGPRDLGRGVCLGVAALHAVVEAGQGVERGMGGLLDEYVVCKREAR